MRLKDFFDMVEKAKAKARPEDLEDEAYLYVSNIDEISTMLAGISSGSPRLLDAFMSGNTLHVMGG